MKETFYFSHDRNSRHDPKIIVMRSKYGYEGYGWYWAIIETLSEQENYKLNIKDKFTISSLAIDLNASADSISKFIHDCIKEFKLLNSDGKLIWSNSLLTRMEKRDNIRQKRREAGKLGALAKQMSWADKQLPEIVQQLPETNEAIVDKNLANSSKERKGKERKGKEKKSILLV